MSNQPQTQGVLLTSFADNITGAITPSMIRDFVLSVPSLALVERALYVFAAAHPAGGHLADTGSALNVTDTDFFGGSRAAFLTALGQVGNIVYVIDFTSGAQRWAVITSVSVTGPVYTLNYSNLLNVGAFTVGDYVGIGFLPAAMVFSPANPYTWTGRQTFEEASDTKLSIVAGSSQTSTPLIQVRWTNNNEIFGVYSDHSFGYAAIGDLGSGQRVIELRARDPVFGPCISFTQGAGGFDFTNYRSITASGSGQIVVTCGAGGATRLQIDSSVSSLFDFQTSAIRVTPGQDTDCPLVVQGFPSQSANLQEWWQSGGTVLTWIDAGGSFGSVNGAVMVQLVAGGIAGHFTDGIFTVDICTGTVAISYVPGDPTQWAVTPPVDVWKALDRIAVALTVLGLSP